MRTLALVVEKKAAPAGRDASPWGQKNKKKRSDAKPDLGPKPGGTIDGVKEEARKDKADPSDATPDHGSGADARPQDPAEQANLFDAADNSADPQDLAGATDGTAPDQSTDEPSADASDGTTAWAGDLDDTGDVTDPANAFANFTGANGEQAWLDRAQDGTLTGWIRDSNGSVYRYSDADAWAIDVDDAGMTPTSAPAAAGDQAEPQTAQFGSATGQDPVQAGLQGKSVRRIVRRTGLPAAPRARTISNGAGALRVTPRR